MSIPVNPPRGMTPAQVISIDTLGAVTPDAIVSRTLLKKDTGTVTYFAFGAGQGLSTHTAPFEALIQGLGGEARVTIGEETYRLQAGELLLLPAGIPHAIETKEDFRMLLIMIRS